MNSVIAVPATGLENNDLLKEKSSSKKPIEPKPNKSTKSPLQLIYDINNRFELGIGESGRSPILGRLYVAGVILPKDGSVDLTNIEDSKTFSARKRADMSTYIKEIALAYHIHYIEPNEIDKINIRQAIMKGMKECILQTRKKVLKQANELKDIKYNNDVFALIDRCDFTQAMCYGKANDLSFETPFTTITNGNNMYMQIAAASILAKVARDDYINELCKRKTELVSWYSIDTNLGYCTVKHIEGIMQKGITQYHRRSYYGSFKKTNFYVI
jgi:ribonuclease HII